MRSRWLASWILPVALFITAAEAPAALWVFVRIADTGTAVPGGAGNFSTLGSPSLGAAGLVFSGRDAASRKGVYAFVDGNLTTLADTASSVLAGDGLFTDFGDLPTAGAADMAFRGLSATQDGIYAGRPGMLTAVADRNAPIPGGAGNFTSFSDPRINHALAFLGGGSGGQQGIYAWSSGLLALVADKNTPMPGTAGNFAFFGSYPATDGTEVVFRGSGLRKGIYLFREGVISVVADSATAVPGGEGTFAVFGEPLTKGGQVVFQGRNNNGHQGIFLSSGGVLQPLVDVNTPIPGGGENFLFFGTSLGFDGGKVAFLGGSASGRLGVYLYADGEVLTVADLSGELDGRTPVSFSYPSLRGNSVAFLAVFSDGSRGVYRADLSLNEPPVALCADVTVRTEPGTCAAQATVDAGSFDPDGDPLTVVQDPPWPYAVGATTVTLTVGDDKGATASCQGVVTVVDGEAPSILALRISPAVLWPPNHRLVPAVISIEAGDNCDPDPQCRITGVASNDLGRSVGDRSPDWLVTGDLSLKLRAERSGRVWARIYTIEVSCGDSSGTTAAGTVKATVPHDRRKKR